MLLLIHKNCKGNSYMEEKAEEMLAEKLDSHLKLKSISEEV